MLWDLSSEYNNELAHILMKKNEKLSQILQSLGVEPEWTFWGLFGISLTAAQTAIINLMSNIIFLYFIYCFLYCLCLVLIVNEL